MSYKDNRNKFYKKIEEEFWDTMLNKEYSLYEPLELSINELNKIRIDSENIYRIINKFNDLLLNATVEELEEDLGFDKKVLSFLKIRSLKHNSIISRLDLCKFENNYKVFEINSDTPTFIKECFYVNELINKEHNKINPNKNEIIFLKEAIEDSIIESCKYINKDLKDVNIVFTSHKEEISKEDFYTTKFLMDLCSFDNVSFSSLDQIIVQNDKILDKDLNKIDILYRQTYPIEHLIEDLNSKNEQIGIKILELYRDKVISIINPISSFLIQSKALLALIWEAYENKMVFLTEEELNIIENNFLPTYFSDEIFKENNIKYVKKTVFGREGDSIDIIDPVNNEIIENKFNNYNNYQKIYQKYIDLPSEKVNTLEGVKKLKTMVGCFIINDKPSSIGIRASETQITDDLSYFLPISQKKE